MLAIDTATEAGLVVVATDRSIRAASQWESRAGHAENMIAQIERVLAQADCRREELDVIGVCVGPGGFTSVRVGMATAKGLALALGKPIVGVLSLRVHARALSQNRQGVCIPVLSAYRGDIFAAAYAWRDGELTELAAAVHGSPHPVLEAIERKLEPGEVVLRGSADPSLHAQGLIEEVCDQFERVGPSDLASLEPTYLRPSDARLPKSAAT